MIRRFFGSTAGQEDAGGGDVEISAVRLNCGGGQIETSMGTFLSDATYFDGGSTFSVGSGIDILNTEDDVLYRTERYRHVLMVYTSKVIPNGTYKVRLHFAELFHQTVGARVFSVWVNDVLFLENYDIIAVTGGRYRAVVEETTISVTNQLIEVDLLRSVDTAKINGIEFIQIA